MGVCNYQQHITTFIELKKRIVFHHDALLLPPVILIEDTSLSLLSGLVPLGLHRTL